MTTPNFTAIAQPTGLQVMMDYWERLHPVNAVQIAELSEEIPLDQLQRAVSRLFAKFRACDSSGRWPSVRRNSDSDDGNVTALVHRLQSTAGHPLDSLVTELLNKRFADDEPPFRVGLAQRNSKHYLCLSYRHSIADARSIALLVQNLLEELFDQRPGDLPSVFEGATRSLSELFPEEIRRTRGWRSVVDSLKTLWSLNRCRRRPPSDLDAFQMTFHLHAERLSLSSLIRQARLWNVTVGELTLAAMLEWFLLQDRLEANSFWSPSRRCVSVLVDLTRRSQPQQPRLFGQYLSPTNIVANHRRHVSFEDLLSQVKANSRRENTVDHSLSTLRGLSVNSFLVNHMPRPFANRYQEFLFPVSGALSNVDLSHGFPPPRTPLPVVNYFRGTCATQFSPMILCLTTVRETCTLTTTHRDAVYSSEEMRDLIDHVRRRAFGETTMSPTQKVAIRPMAATSSAMA